MEIPNCTSNEVYLESRGKPKYMGLIAIDFYDGIEYGIAIFPSGVGIRIRMIDESKFRVFKAHELDILEGNWERYLSFFDAMCGVGIENRSMLLTGKETEFSEFLTQLSKAKVKEKFIGIATLSFDWLLAAPISESAFLNMFENRNDDNVYFIAHQYLKSYEMRHKGIKAQ